MASLRLVGAVSAEIDLKRGEEYETTNVGEVDACVDIDMLIAR